LINERIKILFNSADNTNRYSITMTTLHWVSMGEKVDQGHSWPDLPRPPAVFVSRCTSPRCNHCLNSASACPARCFRFHGPLPRWAWRCHREVRQPALRQRHPAAVGVFWKGFRGINRCMKGKCDLFTKTPRFKLRKRPIS